MCEVTSLVTNGMFDYYHVIEKSFPRFASKDKQLCSVTDPVIVDILSKIAIDGVKKDDAGKIVDFDATSNLPQKMRKPVFAKKFDTALLIILIGYFRY